MLAFALELGSSSANGDRSGQVAARGARSAASAAAAAAAVVTVEVAPPDYDALQALLDDEARLALGRGDYRRAWHFFWRLLLIDPYDTHALRECGRIAHAMGRFTYAAEALGRLDRLTGGAADPEARYLRGEALLALGKRREGERELARAERELGPAPAERRGVLWLARIHALRGDLPRALELYEPLVAQAYEPSAYAELAVLVIEAHILAGDWAAAERKLRALLDEQPAHGRAREMLAWVLEVRGTSGEALALRAALAEEWGDHPRQTAEYARALERAEDDRAALARYREARVLGVDGLEPAIDRLSRRLAPELGGGLTLRRDPSGEVQGWAAGASLGLVGRLRGAVTAIHESTAGGLTAEQASTVAAAATASWRGRRGALAALGATMRWYEGDAAVGGSGLVRANLGRRVQLHARGDVGQPWRESASTVRAGGLVDALATQLYVAPTARLVLSAGGQLRRLGLAATADPARPHTVQRFGFAGVDAVLWTRPARQVRGEILDEELLAPRHLATAAVLSYRHYELASGDPFGARVALIERSRIDELSGVLRQVLDDEGVLGVELRGGLGRDWRRDVRLWRAGASLLLSATAATRLTLDYDIASESGTGLAGRRHGGSVVLHADL